MRLILLTAGGRAGSDFFHSLLDGHSQILQFPGIFRVDNKLKLILKTEDLKKKAKLFIKFYPEFFNSKINKTERWNKLGEKKNRYFQVNKKNFVNNFYKISKKNEKKITSNYECLINLHLAYFVTRKKSIKNIRMLFVHTHLLGWTKKFINLFDIKKIDILHTIRHPLSSLSSPIKSWLMYDKGKRFFSKNLFYQIDTVVNCIYDMNKLGKLYIIKLEKLHTQNTKLMKNFCKKFMINYETNLSISSKNDLEWWGDSLSKEYKNGINKNFKVKIYENHFYERDLIFLQNLTKKIIKKYKYDFYYDNKNILFNLLPMKCEIDVWKNTFNNLFTGCFRWKQLLSIPVFYLLRIFMINKIQINLKNRDLPKEI
ncbi:hypothetical protein OAS33_02495 [Candidatus Pelagibacter ubique]|jgi:hypothetical protein|nr:hypothetical protein [Candidatus Pelagibacter ubique]